MLDSTFATGNAGIDAQHSKLFRTCDKLKELVFRGEATGTLSGVHRAIDGWGADDVQVSVETKTVAAQLLQYAVEHFAYEDVIMENARPAILAAYTSDYASHVRHHRAEHHSFMKTAIIYSGMHETHQVSALALYVFVRHWLVAHINKTDKELVRWLGGAAGLSGATDPT